MSEALCALVLADAYDSENFTLELAQLLPREEAVTELDVRVQVRCGAGFLLRDYPWTAAHDIAELINKAGYECFCVPEAILEPVPKNTRLSRLKIHPKGLECQVSYRWLPLIPWSDIAALHAYAYAGRRDSRSESEHKSKKKGVSVIGIGEGSKHGNNITWNLSSYEDRFSGFRITLCLDLLLCNPLRLFRIEHNAFLFDCLDDINGHSIENYVTLLMLLKEQIESHRNQAGAPTPRRTEMISRESTDIKHYLIDKDEERNHATRWLFLRLERPDIWPGYNFGEGFHVPDDNDEEVMDGAFGKFPESGKIDSLKEGQSGFKGESVTDGIFETSQNPGEFEPLAEGEPGFSVPDDEDV
jgi:hypothetical protein